MKNEKLFERVFEWWQSHMDFIQSHEIENEKGEVILPATWKHKANQTMQDLIQLQKIL